MRALFRLDAKTIQRSVLQQDRWNGNREGNCTELRACTLSFSQVSTPEIPKRGALCDWPEGQLSLVMLAEDAEQYELGKSYWFGMDAVRVEGSAS
jgi:hypothetical protein